MNNSRLDNVKTAITRCKTILSVSCRRVGSKVNEVLKKILKMVKVVIVGLLLLILVLYLLPLFVLVLIFGTLYTLFSR